MSDQLQLRRDTLANIQAAIPAQGELAYATDTAQLFIGDGATPGGILQGPSAPFPGYKAGRYYTASSTSATGFTVAANTIYGVPFLAAARVTFTKLSINVTTGIAATSARIGIYANSPSTIGPGALVAGSDSGSFSTASAGVQEVTGLSITLNPGFYWFAAIFSGTPTVTGCNGFGVLLPLLIGMSSPGAANNDFGYSASQTFGAMPATFPAGTFINTNNAMPLIAARL